MLAQLKKRPYLGFIAPGLVLYALFVVYPIVSAAWISLTRWSGIGPSTFIGFANYRELFSSSELLGQLTGALRNNAFIFAFNALLVLPVQLFMAYLIYTKVKGFRFFQAMIFAPQFIASSVVVFLAALLLDGNIGLVNRLFEQVGLASWSKPWLGLPEYGIVVVALLNAWSGIGVGMIFFVGAMKMVPADTIEAALLDGAGYWRRFFAIVAPMIRRSIVNMLILTYIFAMTAFDYNFLLGGVSGGIGRSVDVMSLFFYRIAFGSNSSVGGTMNTNAMGMGTTIACVMFAFIFIVAMVQLRLSYRSGAREE